MSIEDRIAGKTARVGVIGLGYVGLPLAVTAARAGFPVTGFDVDPSKITRIDRGRPLSRDNAMVLQVREVNRRPPPGVIARAAGVAAGLAAHNRGRTAPLSPTFMDVADL